MLFIRDLPPVSTINMQVTQPSIYFGELSNEYVIARTRAREFHYPKGEDNVYADYDGQGGIPLSSLLRKLLFAAHFRAYQILLSDDITTREPADVRPADSRRASARSRRFSPTTRIRIRSFTTAASSGFRTPTRPRIAIPYSTRRGRQHQLHPQLPSRSSSTPITASVTFYLAEPDDPIVQTLTQDVSRRCFRPLGEMPAGPAAPRALSRRHLQHCRRRCTRPTT